MSQANPKKAKPTGKLRERRAERAARAQARQHVRDMIHPQAQLAAIEGRPGNSSRERARLMKQIEKG